MNNLFLDYLEDDIEFIDFSNIKNIDNRQTKINIKTPNELLLKFLDEEISMNDTKIDLEGFIIHPHYLMEQKKLNLIEISNEELKVSNLLKQILHFEEEDIDFVKVNKFLNKSAISF